MLSSCQTKTPTLVLFLHPPGKAHHRNLAEMEKPMFPQQQKKVTRVLRMRNTR